MGKATKTITAALMLILGLGTAHGSPRQLLGIDVNSQGAAIELDGPVQYHAFLMKHPARLVIDLEETTWNSGPLSIPVPVGTLERVRTARRGRHDHRVVFDLAEAPEYRIHWARNEDGRARLVIRWNRDHPDDSLAIPVPPTVSAAKGHLRALEGCPSVPLEGQFVVAVDAGHGGDDAGAVGKGGHQEKHIALQIAYRLHRLISRSPKMHSVLTRKRDHLIPLKTRYRIARACGAHLLVSIHADSLGRQHVNGATVYVYPPAASNGRLVVAANNRDLRPPSRRRARDAVAGLGRPPSNPTATASFTVATEILDAFAGSVPLLRPYVEEARFMVLSSEIPSVLVETGFISNPAEERALSRPAYQEKLSRALFNGIARYADLHTRLRARSRQLVHIPGRRTDLESLARRYGVSVKSLHQVNDDLPPVVPIGRPLRIPVYNLSGRSVTARNVR